LQTKEFELSVGQAIRIGDRVITVVDIDSGEVAFRIDDSPFDRSEPEFGQEPSPRSK
jgi:hypothetical protein